MKAIILTEAQADKVRGMSPSDGYAALAPVPLKDGTWALGEQVLNDPAHADVRDFLTALPRQEASNLSTYSSDIKAEAEAFAAKTAGKDFRAVRQPDKGAVNLKE